VRPQALVANRFAHDRSGRLFDLATGFDVTIDVGALHGSATEAAVRVLDSGRLDDGTRFVATTRSCPRPQSPLPPAAHREGVACLVRDALDHADSAEPGRVVLSAEPPAHDSDVITVAHEAREAGFVPVSPRGLARLPVTALLALRSVVVLEDVRGPISRAPSHDGSDPALESVLLALGALRARGWRRATRACPTSPRAPRRAGGVRWSTSVPIAGCRREGARSAAVETSNSSWTRRSPSSVRGTSGCVCVMR
jgi:hypothetical protein